MQDTDVKCVLLDIEGTVLSINFIKDVLFPYSRNNCEAYLRDNWSKDEIKSIVKQLLGLGDETPALSLHLTPSVIKIHELIDQNAKTPALKELQGYIWKAGYSQGDLRAELYPDVNPNLEHFKKVLGMTLAIYSSGSVLAQKLLFSHTQYGDVTQLFEGNYFDLNNAGSKLESSSYTKIASVLGIEPGKILFLTDVAAEAHAATGAGMLSKLVVRPGNVPLTDDDKKCFHVITTFDSLLK